MTRRILLFLVLGALALTGLTVYASVVQRDATGGSYSASFGSGDPPPLDSALAELEAGRHWHAARLLRARLDAGGGEDDPATRLLLARAEAGWKNWAAVRSLLEGESWLGEREGGLGWALLARAREEAEKWEEAVAAYEEALGRPVAEERETELLAGLARSLAGAGGTAAAVLRLDTLRRVSGALADWLALELGATAAERGDAEAVRSFLSTVEASPIRDRGWALVPRARLVVGDSAGAAAAYREAAGARSGAERARALVVSGGLALALGDTAAARRDLERALEAAPEGAAGADAAARLARLPGVEGQTLLRAAGALARSGRGDAALAAYERAGVGPGASDGTRLAVARLRGRDGFDSEEISTLEALAGSADAEVAAAALDLLADAHRGMGDEEESEAVEDRLVERFPGRAGSVLFFRADRRHDRGDLAGAAEGYRRMVERAPSGNLGGLAAMRLGQLHLTRDDPGAAEAVFGRYMEAFPDGERWDQAAYWRAHALRLLGRAEEADRLLRSIRERDFLSYYSLLASRIQDEVFLPDLPPGPDQEETPEWLRDGLREVDLLTAVGLDEAAEAETEALRERAVARGEGLLLLSEELTARGHGLAGIGLGWELRRRGQPWSLRLLRAVFPLPYREMIRREAAERGVDSTLMVAVARQESAFDADIRSSANAVGLIQVLPETARDLAAAVGPEPFSPALLEVPEINLHLGAQYLRDMGERYGGELTLLLSAYNAGPHRADVWQEFPEADDPLRFTERIPFRETRDYVKQITRNRALYEALWGIGSGDGGDGATPDPGSEG